MPWPRIVLISFALFAGGCTEQLARRTVQPPNGGMVPDARFDPPGSFRVETGPPEAKIFVRVVDPPGVAPKGTVLVVHGYLISGDLMFNKAGEVTAAGYRAIVVDLRGHGKSTGTFISFGYYEARDLSQVIDALEERKLVVGKIGAVGMSLGGATCIQLAGRDPRVAAVVAMCPFATIQDILPNVGRTNMPLIGWRSDEEYRAVVEQAGKIAGFDPEQSSALLAITKTKAPVLLVHGTSDGLVSSTQSEKLYEAGKDHAKLVLLPGVTHESIWTDLDNKVRNEMIAWLDQHLAPAGAEAKK